MNKNEQVETEDEQQRSKTEIGQETKRKKSLSLTRCHLFPSVDDGCLSLLFHTYILLSHFFILIIP